MEMCYNDCKLNRTESKPKTRCQICQLQVHNICLDESKKTISSGAWTCRDCRKNPLNTQILLELVTGLCEKIAVLEPIIISLQNHNLFTSSSTQTDSLSDGTHMSTQTEAEYALPDVQSDHVIDVSIHTPSTTNDTTDSIVIQTRQPTDTVQELTYDELSDTSSDDEFITLSQLSINESKYGVQESLDALLESLASPIPLLHSTPSASLVLDTEILTHTHVPAPNVTTNDIDSLSHAPQIEQHTPPSDQVIPHRVLPPESDNNYHDVFIGNVRGIITIDDIKGHLLDCGVRDIGNITQLSSRHHAAFRVFIGDENIDNTVYNREHWNERIKVEPYKKRMPTRNQRMLSTVESRNQRNETSRRRYQRNRNNIFSPHTPRHMRAPRFKRTHTLDVMGKSAWHTTEQQQNHGSTQHPRITHNMNPHNTQHHNNVRSTSYHPSYLERVRSDTEYSSLNQFNAEEFPNHRPSNHYRDLRLYPQQSGLGTSSGHQSITPYGDHRNPSVHCSPPQNHYVNTAQYNHQ